MRGIRWRPGIWWGFAASLIICSPWLVQASMLLLKDGRTLEGNVGKSAHLADDPRKPRGQETTIMTFVDDGLRRIFVPTNQIAKIVEINAREKPEKIVLDQPVAESGKRVARMGPIVRLEPFDDQGRRTLTMMTDNGPLDIIQGITEITPVWTKVQGLATRGQAAIVLDMRIATSSIPLEKIKAILARRIDPKDLNHRLKLVRLLMQMNLYQEAQRELQAVVKDFPDQARLQAQVQEIGQMYARKIVDEIKLRGEAGQHHLAQTLLDGFPTENVAGEVLEQVRELLDDYRQTKQKRDQVLAELTALRATVAGQQARQQCHEMVEEISAELSAATLERMAAYLQLRDDKTMSAEQKLSLAISGWLLGSVHAQPNLAMSLALLKARQSVIDYMKEPTKIGREAIIKQMQGLEFVSLPIVAQLIANMKPLVSTPEPSVAEPGFYQRTVPIGLEGEADVTYYVQLPPEYDPHVRYPTVVTLNGAFSSPQQQLDWWAGAQGDKGNRLGQATRRGYIVVSIDWMKEGQQEYGFTAREHAAVLTSLRDACRRFSINTDRVFLSGHSMGGDAAWDIGLAHPDLWAGVIPIAARADRYCKLYWGNAKLVPFYVLGGELDGDKTVENGKSLDHYMKARYDVTVTEYLGRGHENLYDDILEIFDWMGRRPSRNFFPKEFEVGTLRPWDNYFWWFEGHNFPPQSMIDPAQWENTKASGPFNIRGRIGNNNLAITTGRIDVTVWLSPEMVDFSKTIQVKLNDKMLNKSQRIEPNLGVLLEDVLTRGDRQHPFWAKVE